MCFAAKDGRNAREEKKKKLRSRAPPAHEDAEIAKRQAENRRREQHFFFEQSKQYVSLLQLVLGVAAFQIVRTAFLHPCLLVSLHRRQSWQGTRDERRTAVRARLPAASSGPARKRRE